MQIFTHRWKLSYFKLALLCIDVGQGLTIFLTKTEGLLILRKIHYSLADSGVDLDLRCIENVLTD